MSLEIAKRIKKSAQFNNENPNTSKASPIAPTNRRSRRLEAANDSIYDSSCLPKYFYDGGEHNEFYGDRYWILAKLRRVINHQHRQGLAQQYGIIFKRAYDAEPVEYQKHGKARFIANKWLLEKTK